MLREALRLQPGDATYHANLGEALAGLGQWEEAVSFYRHAARVKPSDTTCRLQLGRALHDAGKIAEAVDCCREAVRLQPGDLAARINLANTLRAQGKYAEAATCYREVLRTDPGSAAASCNLGHALQHLGQFRAALEAYRRGHELGAKDPSWKAPSERWVRETEQMAALECKLPGVLRGEARPADAADLLVLAKLCTRGRQLPAAAVGLYREAFKVQPRAADDLRAGHRYDTACCAVLAATGVGQDGPADQPERGRLREEAPSHRLDPSKPGWQTTGLSPDSIL